MRRFTALLLLLLAGGACARCGVYSFCNTGEMRCLGDTVQTCNADHEWKDWLSCWKTGLTCSTDPARCGGYGDIACCDQGP